MKIFTSVTTFAMFLCTLNSYAVISVPLNDTGPSSGQPSEKSRRDLDIEQFHKDYWKTFPAEKWHLFEEIIVDEIRRFASWDSNKMRWASRPENFEPLKAILLNHFTLQLHHQFPIKNGKELYALFLANWAGMSVADKYFSTTRYESRFSNLYLRHFSEYSDNCRDTLHPWGSIRLPDCAVDAWRNAYRESEYHHHTALNQFQSGLFGPADSENTFLYTLAFLSTKEHLDVMQNAYDAALKILNEQQFSLSTEELHILFDDEMWNKKPIPKEYREVAIANRLISQERFCNLTKAEMDKNPLIAWLKLLLTSFPIAVDNPIGKSTT